MNGGKLLSAIAGPLLVLAAIGLLLGKCSGEPMCPVDPQTGKQICSKYNDHEAYSRATRAELD